MYPAKVVIREMQSARGLEIVQLLGIAKGQSCKPLDGLTHREVLPLHIASGDVPHVWPSITYFYYRFHHRGGRISACRVVLAIVAIYLYHLREVGLSCEYVLNSLAVEVEPIG